MTKVTPPSGEPWDHPDRFHETIGRKLNNGTSTFMTAWYNATEQRLTLEVPAPSLGAPFVVAALVSRADGTESLLSEPATGTDQNVFEFRLAPNGKDLDLVVPQQLLRLPPGNHTEETEDMYTTGAWPGFSRTLPATPLVDWVLRLNGTEDSDGACAAFGPARLRLGGLNARPVRGETARPASAEESAAEAIGCDYEVEAERPLSYMVDASEWVRGGVVLGVETALTDSRLAGGAGFTSNFNVQVQGRLKSLRPPPPPPPGARPSGPEQPPPALQLELSFAELPPLDRAWASRAADDRLGYWTTHYTRLGAPASGPVSARAAEAQVRHIQRWRLDKLHPERPLSPPVTPITFHIDPSVPPRWRQVIRRGVEAWNPAFESAGFTGAVRAVLPTDAHWPEDYSAGDLRYSSISWAVSSKQVYAVGPHTLDPRSGQILDADVMISARWIEHWAEVYGLNGPEPGGEEGGAGRGRRADEATGLGESPLGAGWGEAADEELSSEAGGGGGGSPLLRRLRRAQAEVDSLLEGGGAGGAAVGRARRGAHASHPGPCGRSGHEQHFAQVGLAAAASLLDRGGSGVASGASGAASMGEAADAQSFIEQALIEVVAHEVGHTLGLRHNFKGSAAYSLSELSEPGRTSLTASVMDYTAPMVPSDRAKQRQYYSTSVGAYDHWAIRYGYTVVEGEVSGEQHPLLAEIAAEGASRRELAFATDEDHPRSDGVDPTASTWDMSSDPVAFFTDRLALAQKLLSTAAERTVLPGESWTRQAHAVDEFMRAALLAGSYVAKHLGGYVFSRGHRGDAGAAPPVVPVDASAQVRALSLALQVVTQSFWLPAAAAAARMPRHVGFGTAGTPCGESASLDEYCLGLGPPSLVRRAAKIRKLVLLQLVQPQRLSGLAEHEWEVEQGGLSTAAVDEPGGGDDAAQWETPPAAVGSSVGGGEEGAEAAEWAAALEGSPSVTALLGAIHAGLALPRAAHALTAEARERPAMLKVRLELQRVWIAILAGMTKDGYGEAAAAAAGLLTGLLGEAARETDAAAPPPAASGWGCLEDEVGGGAAAAAHCASLSHSLRLWARGVPIPMPA